MRRINGIVYLDEEEWEDEGMREKYPDALLMKTYTKMYGEGNRLYSEKFITSGMNRAERRRRK